MTKEEEIKIVHGKGTHVVILGAGATYASTLKNPEKNGKTLPLMWNVIDIVGLSNVVKELPKEYQLLKEDFEKLYSLLAKDDKFKAEREYIEKVVYQYFNELELPNEPTIYDHLILSLRHRKDIIATFNWDPFLYKAYARNGEFTESPGILFLHGCVSLGYDKSNGSSGPSGWFFSKEHVYKQALLFIGSAHRKSIIKKIEIRRKQEKSEINWSLFGSNF